MDSVKAFQDVLPSLNLLHFIFFYIFLALEQRLIMEVIEMAKRTESNLEGLNPEKRPSRNVGYQEEMAQEPLSTKQKLNNKRRKKNQ
ncbi:hypothetical protein ACA30_02345 [Virgibacillus soli]|uniref:Small acid-soluble spore protein O n=1 Tax=Lederbergia galactosidilytica TaxID=217031 RepID=A0A178A1N8_9BACI|nr:hypothetical protein ACA30_02345 [Virgibacillus soli]OAK74014.1 hypothetical protein ABB05_06265 [Lederbergia galactosidilytica]